LYCTLSYYMTVNHQTHSSVRVVVETLRARSIEQQCFFQRPPSAIRRLSSCQPSPDHRDRQQPPLKEKEQQSLNPFKTSLPSSCLNYPDKLTLDYCSFAAQRIFPKDPSPFSVFLAFSFSLALEPPGPPTLVQHPHPITPPIAPALFILPPRIL
jgi:hypothetical protein